MDIIRRIWNYPEEMYNCSGRTTEEWEARGEKWPFLGSYLVVAAIIAIIFYVLCMYAMYRLHLLKFSCYRIMFVLGVLDCGNLINNSVISGYEATRGHVFCLSPVTSYIQGHINHSFWIGASSLYVTLGFNRVVAMTGIRSFDWLFKRFGGWLWLAFTIVYAFIGGWVYTPMPFNSKVFSCAFIPFIDGDFEKEVLQYDNPFLLGNNIFVTTGILTCYGFLVSFLIFYRKHVTQEAERKVCLQALLISVPTCTASGIYVYIQYFEHNIHWNIAGHLFWHICTGIAPLIYLTINKEIRQFYFGKKSKVSTISITKPNPNIVNEQECST